ncbi:hypothetical protein GmHk_11G031985 [Glycine max]|nr:hypothetical protein GmHk_11G031985 [Glycine max]
MYRLIRSTAYELAESCSDYIGKNSSLTSARDKGKIEYISGGQSSPYELTFRIELGPNSHSKRVKWKV